MLARVWFIQHNRMDWFDVNSYEELEKKCDTIETTGGIIKRIHFYDDI